MKYLLILVEGKQGESLLLAPSNVDPTSWGKVKSVAPAPTGLLAQYGLKEMRSKSAHVLRHGRKG